MIYKYKEVSFTKDVLNLKTKDLAGSNVRLVDELEALSLENWEFVSYLGSDTILLRREVTPDEIKTYERIR